MAGTSRVNGLHKPTRSTLKRFDLYISDITEQFDFRVTSTEHVGAAPCIYLYIIPAPHSLADLKTPKTQAARLPRACLARIAPTTWSSLRTITSGSERKACCGSAPGGEETTKSGSSRTDPKDDWDMKKG
jgi:hypothetical protein